MIGAERLYEPDPSRRLNLPYDVPANEFLNLEGQKISGSRNWAVWGLDFLDALRPRPAALLSDGRYRPETRDSEWEWADFVRRNNDELVATWGNLVNRVLSFAYRHWEGHVPDPGELGPLDQALLAEVDGGFASVGRLLEAVRLRDALQTGLSLAKAVNVYLDRAPWFSVVKTDRPAAARTVYTALRAIDSLKVLLAPFLPFTAERLHTLLGYAGRLFGEQHVVTLTDHLGEHQALVYDPAAATGRWAPSELKSGQLLNEPAPLYRKLDDWSPKRRRRGWDRRGAEDDMGAS